MLDRIGNNNNIDLINQSSNLEKISNVENAFETEKEDFNLYFIDESQISNEAFQKYQREVDIKTFSEILKESDETEANNLVLKTFFEDNNSITDNEFLSSILNNDDFLNNILNEIAKTDN